MWSGNPGWHFSILTSECLLFGTLDPFRLLLSVLCVETPPIKVLGKLRKPPWQRFVRLQRTAAQLARGRGQPKGVFRFATHEDLVSPARELNRLGVSYVVVDGFAINRLGFVRATEDIDLLIARQIERSVN